jgi:hypothetical protein
MTIDGLRHSGSIGCTTRRHVSPLLPDDYLLMINQLWSAGDGAAACSA